MALINGDPAVVDSPLPYTVYNKIKDHWYGATAPSNPQNGMIWVKNDGTIQFYHSGTWYLLLDTRGADIASADPLVPGADGNFFHVTGTTNFTTINAAQSQPGTVHCYVFDGILTMTHHATDLILPGGANITTAAGDRAIFIEEDTDKWRCVVYTKADGTAIVAVTDKIEEGDSSVEVIDAGTGYIETKADNSQVRKDQVVGNLQPLQPAFLAYNSATDPDVTGDGTTVTVDFDTEVFDQGGNFAADVFTAPVTGRYLFTATVYLIGIAVASNLAYITLVTSNGSYRNDYMLLTNITYGAAITLNITAIVDMDAADTAFIRMYVANGAKTTDIEGGGNRNTRFAGYLLC